MGQREFKRSLESWAHLHNHALTEREKSSVTSVMWDRHDKDVAEAYNVLWGLVRAEQLLLSTKDSFAAVDDRVKELLAAAAATPEPEPDDVPFPEPVMAPGRVR